jgi:hypothetical protein
MKASSHSRPIRVVAVLLLPEYARPRRRVTVRDAKAPRVTEPGRHAGKTATAGQAPRGYQRGMWRLATEGDDEVLVEMCLELHEEDPGPSPVDARHMRQTLSALRREPWRGRAVVLESGQQVRGYALLIAFWSNELGGEVCHVGNARARRLYERLGFATVGFSMVKALRAPDAEEAGIPRMP